MENQRISVTLDYEETTMLEELKKYYHVDTSNFIRTLIRDVHKSKPNLIFEKETNVDKTGEIFLNMLNFEKYQIGRKANIFKGAFGDKKETVVLVIQRVMSLGESLVIRISPSRWSAYSQAVEEIGNGKILIAYKLCTEKEFQLILVDHQEIGEPLFKEKPDKTHFFYISRLKPVHKEQTIEFLGDDYKKILDTLNDL